MFTGDVFADGADTIISTLQKHNIKASFFLTGRFYNNPTFSRTIRKLKARAHYLGPHSDQHLLYCDWSNRDSLLVTKKQFKDDLNANIRAIEKYGVNKSSVTYFIPPYEWYNDSISRWTKETGMQLINYSPGTKSTADYTWPELKNYRSSQEILQSILDKEKNDEHGLNGFILLLHIGTDPRRTDKFYCMLDELLSELKNKGYQFTLLKDLLQQKR